MTITGLAVLMGLLVAAGAGAQQTKGGGPAARARMTAEGSGLAPAPWLQEDPGARAYAQAREALNARRYREAVEAFAALRQQYSRSVYVADSYYWQAFALSRLGAQSDYRQARDLLRSQIDGYPNAGTIADARELLLRVESQLARAGDAQAAQAVTQQAAAACGPEEELRAAALSALLNMNAERAVPILKEVLQSRDACSAELRRQAVFLISQHLTDETVGLLLDLAHRNPDPDPEVREQAVFWLSQVRSEEALDALQAILRESDDPDVQEKAIFAVSQHESERSTQILRQYAESASAPAALREQAIFWIGQTRGGPQYLMELYGRLQDPDLKEKAIFGISQQKGEASRRWLLERASSAAEPLELRKNALFWAGQAGAFTVGELRELFRAFSEDELREQVIFVASQRNEPAAVDFLMEVARDRNNGEMREKAIFWLGQSKDPRAADFLLSLIKGGGQ
jgi:HEAT repeat protein